MMDKQHIIYKITNQLNNRFYVGMHTGYPDDGYLGSGKRIKAEIKKYGKENFKKEILEVLPTRKDLEYREAEIVNEELLANPLCLNLKNGGEGGGKLWSKNHHEKMILAGASAGGKSAQQKLTTEERSLRATKAARTRKERGEPGTFTGRKHSEETRRKISEAFQRKKTRALSPRVSSSVTESDANPRGYEGW